MKRHFKRGPEETHSLDPYEVRKARSSFTRNATIGVQLNDWGTHAQISSGDFVPVMPDIKINIEFIGEWENKEKMDTDMSECIKKVMDTYQNHISGNLLSSSQN